MAVGHSSGEFDDAWFFGCSGDIEHADESSFAGAEEWADVDGDGECAFSGLVWPDGDAASEDAVFAGVGFIEADGRPAGPEFDEGAVF